MTETKQAALKRLRRKVEIMDLDFRAANNTRHHDTAEMLKLIEILEKEA
jgi:hypothetical protein